MYITIIFILNTALTYGGCREPNMKETLLTSSCAGTHPGDSLHTSLNNALKASQSAFVYLKQKYAECTAGPEGRAHLER